MRSLTPLSPAQANYLSARLMKLLFWAVTMGTLTSRVLAAEDRPALLDQTVQLEGKLNTQLEQLNAKLKEMPKSVGLYSHRGDTFFFLMKFPDAVADYDQMVQLNPEVDASHWRRGIAYFYNREFDKAVAQFERYHAFDDVDRENGIWRYFSMYKAKGKDAARKELLRYEKDDREPFPDVYRLFAGEITPAEIVSRIESKEVPAHERALRKFYGYLYLGLNEAVEGRTESAIPYLQQAVENQWGQTAGYGPRYMWQVGRIQLELLQQAKPE